MGKTKRKGRQREQNERGEELWEVQEIVEQRESDRWYLLRWCGLDPATGKPWELSWEPPHNLYSVDNLLDDFYARKGKNKRVELELNAAISGLGNQVQVEPAEEQPPRSSNRRKVVRMTPKRRARVKKAQLPTSKIVDNAVDVDSNKLDRDSPFEERKTGPLTYVVIPKCPLGHAFGAPVPKMPTEDNQDEQPPDNISDSPTEPLKTTSRFPKEPYQPAHVLLRRLFPDPSKVESKPPEPPVPNSPPPPTLPLPTPAPPTPGSQHSTTSEIPTFAFPLPLPLPQILIAPPGEPPSVFSFPFSSPVLSTPLFPLGSPLRPPPGLPSPAPPSYASAPAQPDMPPAYPLPIFAASNVSSLNFSNLIKDDALDSPARSLPPSYASRSQSHNSLFSPSPGPSPSLRPSPLDLFSPRREQAFQLQFGSPPPPQRTQSVDAVPWPRLLPDLRPSPGSSAARPAHSTTPRAPVRTTLDEEGEDADVNLFDGASEDGLDHGSATPRQPSPADTMAHPVTDRSIMADSLPGEREQKVKVEEDEDWDMDDEIVLYVPLEDGQWVKTEDLDEQVNLPEEP